MPTNGYMTASVKAAPGDTIQAWLYPAGEGGSKQKIVLKNMTQSQTERNQA